MPSGNIQSLLNDILNAVYGRDVRDSIHDAIELCYDDVSTGKTIAEAAADTVDDSVAAATSAANAATAAAASANDAADAATAAASHAETASSGLSSAIQSANTAATNATNAATDATDAATAATNAANAANTAAAAAQDAIDTIEEIDVDTDLVLQAITDANNAATAANNAASSATTATTAANNAADNANTKAADANNAVNSVSTALASVTAALTNVNDAKDATILATTNANNAKDAANTATANANAATANANTAAADANTAVTNANAKIAAMDSKLLDAQSAINNANTAASNATAAVTSANAAVALINGLTVDSEDVGPNVPASAVLQTVDGHKNIHFCLRQGSSGASYIIKGSAYATLADLQTDITNPEVGDQYNVGSAPPYHVYRWTGTSWEDQGIIGSGSGSGSGGTIESITAQDVQTIQNGSTIEGSATKVMKAEALSYLIHDVIEALLAGKVDKITGKGLSTNDFTNENLTDLNSAINAITVLSTTKVDAVTGKGLSTNDFTDELAQKVAMIGTGALSTTANTLIGAINEILTNKASLASPAFSGTPTAPTAASGTNNTQIATTEFVQGEIYGLGSSLSGLNASIAAKPDLEQSNDPQMDGTASVGTATTASRSDHVHPTDTSRAPINSPAFTGSPTADTPLATDSSTRIATTAFVQGKVSDLQSSIASKADLESATNPAANGAASPGTATTASRSDHVHPTDTTRAPLASPAFTGSPTATTPATTNSSTRIATTAYVQANFTSHANIYVTNVSASSWTNQGTSATYSDFPYRAALTTGDLANVTSSMFAFVAFNPTQVLSGNYAPVCQTYNGGVYIYSKVNTSITIPTIAVFR